MTILFFWHQCPNKGRRKEGEKWPLHELNTQNEPFPSQAQYLTQSFQTCESQALLLQANYNSFTLLFRCHLLDNNATKDRNREKKKTARKGVSNQWKWHAFCHFTVTLKMKMISFKWKICCNNFCDFLENSFLCVLDLCQEKGLLEDLLRKSLTRLLKT